jgi:redox-sensitive bicupin YhaK (pirin superfamily)
MTEQLEATRRKAAVVDDAMVTRMMGLPVLQVLPSRSVPYEQVDPFILVHEGRHRLSELDGADTGHPHRGFDNLWYVLDGVFSTDPSTGPAGSMERARTREGSLVALRRGRGVWRAEDGDELEGPEERPADSDFRGVLFWVNLARDGKHAQHGAQVLQREQIPVRHQGDATVRVLVGEGSPLRLGTPALILDVELPTGGEVTTDVPPEFQGLVYVLEGEATFGANRRRARRRQLVLLDRGDELSVTDASPGTRYMLMAGQPYRVATPHGPGPE